MACLRSRLRRNRGLAIALGLVSVVLIGYASLSPTGPRVSWKERFTPADEKGGFDRDDYGYGEEFLVAPDGRALLSVFHERVKVRDVATGRVAELKFNEPASNPRLRMDEARFLAGGRLVVGLICDPDEPEASPVALKVYEVPSGRERIAFGEIEGGSEWPPFAISRDGSTLAYAMGKPGPPTVGVWNAQEDRPPVDFAGSGPLALSDDGQLLALLESSGSEARIVVREVASTKRLTSIAVAAPFKPVKIAFSPDGKTLAESWRDETILEDSAMKKIILRDVATSSIKHVLSIDEMIPSDPRFSPDGSLLFLLWPKFEGVRMIKVWDLAVNPPRHVFYGEHEGLSRDGHRMAQSGPNYLDQAAYDPSPKTRPSRIVELPSMKLVGRDGVSWYPHFFRRITLNPEGGLAAIATTRGVPSWSQRLSGWLPPGLRPAPPRWIDLKVQSEVRVIDPDSGDCLRMINSGGRAGFVEDGKTLALQRWMPSKDPSGPRYELVELWDVPGPFSKWPVLGVLAVVALVLGRWYDVRARGRANVAPVPV